ncbi:MAG: adenine phosphoribosyltransferase [Spirochaetaceae bacterium]|nr:MAG: adenine phosphoribosyltransferase [Spirochaetaceae bacterium]
MFDLDKAIRRVPDFPKPGILFYDITSVLTNPKAFSFCIEKMHELFPKGAFDAVAAIESRGFLFASPYARESGLPLVLIRKKGKLPGETLQEEFTLEYGRDIIEVHKADVEKGQKILLVDDLVATGGTLKAACNMLERAGASVPAIFAVIGLPFLNYQSQLPGRRIETLVNFHGE